MENSMLVVLLLLQHNNTTYIGMVQGLKIWVGTGQVVMRHAALRARIAQNVKKHPLRVSVIYFEFFAFNVSIWVPWSLLGPKKSCKLV